MKVEDSPKLATQLIYFSFATMTTTGYGDIAPLHPVARACAISKPSSASSIRRRCWRGW